MYELQVLSYGIKNGTPYYCTFSHLIMCLFSDITGIVSTIFFLFLQVASRSYNIKKIVPFDLSALDFVRNAHLYIHFSRLMS